MAVAVMLKWTSFEFQVETWAECLIWLGWVTGASVFMARKLGHLD